MTSPDTYPKPDYRDATPEQVAKAILLYNPEDKHPDPEDPAE